MITTSEWSGPRPIDTRNGKRLLRCKKLTDGDECFKAWGHDKDAMKAARFSVGKAYQAAGWEICHWENCPGQFEVDIDALNGILSAAIVAEEEAKKTMAIDYIDEEFEPLTSQSSDRLFSWQRPSAQRLVNALMRGNALDASQTGAGKTFVALAACAELGFTPYVIAPLAVLESWRRAALMMDVVLGGVTNYDKARAGSSDFIAKNKGAKKKGQRAFSFQPAPPRSALFSRPPESIRPLLIFDEIQKCFPYETLIETNFGHIQIGDIVENRLCVWVAAWNPHTGKSESRKVVNYWRNKPGKLMIIRHEHGTLRCTPEHKIWASGSWKQAKEIRHGDVLRLRLGVFGEIGLETEDMRPQVRCKIPSDVARMGNQPTRRMDAGSKGENVSNNEGTVDTLIFGSAPAEDASSKSNEQSGYARCGYGEAPRKNIPIARREREPHSATGDTREYAGASNGAPDWNSSGDPITISEPSEMLQSRHRVPICEARRRSGRPESHDQEMEVSGPQEGSDTHESRVVDTAFYEHPSGSQRRGLRGNGALYDIEIEGLHNYFANGVLVHNCKGGERTQQGQILVDTVLEGTRILCLSATAAKDPTEMEGIGMALNLHEGGKSYAEWMKKHGCKRGVGGYFFTDNVQAKQEIMQKIHRTIFPRKGTRIRSTDVPGYPENAVSAHLIENTSIVTAYEEMQSNLEIIETKRKANEIDKRQAAASGLAEIMKARRASEIGKLPFIIEETKELIADGFQVAIFLNFREHLAIVRDGLGLKYAPVWGTAWLRKEQRRDDKGVMRWFDVDGPAQKPQDRQQLIDDFQSGKNKVILVSLQAGGAGISLHDVNGIAPRQSIISPSYSAIDLVQAIGRCWRAGSQSKATQRIIYAASTIEEQIAASVTSKIQNIETLCDGDLQEDSLSHFTHYDPEH